MHLLYEKLMHLNLHVTAPRLTCKVIKIPTQQPQKFIPISM